MLNFYFNADEKKLEIQKFNEKKISITFFKQNLSLYILFFVLKSSETYAQNILWSLLFEGEGGLRIII